MEVSKRLWVSEHGRIYRGQNSAVLPDGNLELRSSDFDALLGLLEESDQAAQALEPIFRYSRRNRRDVLTVQNYVGVIGTPGRTQIEVLPKIAKQVDPADARRLLVQMLMTLRNSPFREGSSASLDARKMPLFEIVYRRFLEHTVEVVRKGIARDYVPTEGNLVYLKGKLDWPQNIRHNSAHSDRFYCHYDEFAVDRPINRLMKGALIIVLRHSQDRLNQQLCRELLFWFEGAKATQSPQKDFQQIYRDRNTQHYDLALPVCRLILGQLNPLTEQGQARTTSLLFPMEQVFEDYVAVKLRRQLKNDPNGPWKIRTQISGQHLVERHKGRPRFALKPDIELKRGNTRVIADTKWKLIYRDSSWKSNYGISQSDIYQMFAYSRKYLQHRVTGDAPRLILLIYPMTEAFSDALEPFYFTSEHEILLVLPFNLYKGEVSARLLTEFVGA